MEIIGIDEAGRGPLAGPVVVAGVKIRSAKTAKRLFAGIRDSKRLSPKKREEWFLRLTRHSFIEYAVARVGNHVIDRVNITRAANIAAARVYRRLSSEKGRVFAVLDGGLYLPDSIPQKTIIKGDEKIPVIAAASVIAKVTRDRIMVRLYKKFPRYRFDLHKGYGTRFHRRILRSIGRSEVHRASFRF